MDQIKELIQALDVNPLATQALLRHANSPHYAFERRITDPKQAIVLLGTGRVTDFIRTWQGGVQ